MFHRAGWLLVRHATRAELRVGLGLLHFPWRRIIFAFRIGCIDIAVPSSRGGCPFFRNTPRRRARFSAHPGHRCRRSSAARRCAGSRAADSNTRLPRRGSRQAGRDPCRHLGHPAHLCEVAIRRVLRARFQRGTRPAVADRSVAPTGSRKTRRGVRSVDGRARSCGAALSLSRRRGSRRARFAARAT